MLSESSRLTGERVAADAALRGSAGALGQRDDDPFRLQAGTSPAPGYLACLSTWSRELRQLGSVDHLGQQEDVTLHSGAGLRLGPMAAEADVVSATR